MMYNPSGTFSTPEVDEYTLSWLPSNIRLTVWSNPLSLPSKKKKKKLYGFLFTFPVKQLLTTITLPSDVITDMRPMCCQGSQKQKNNSARCLTSKYKDTFNHLV